MSLNVNLFICEIRLMIPVLPTLQGGFEVHRHFPPHIAYKSPVPTDNLKCSAGKFNIPKILKLND